MSLLARTKAHYEKNRGEAMLGAARALQALGLDVRISNCSRRTIEAIGSDWGDQRRPELSWNWEAILHRYKDLKSLDLAVWTPDDRLVMVAIATVSGAALHLRYVEGDPRADCDFKGKRVLMALEVATRYAQLNGLTELRINPVNDALAALYETVYGFALVTPRGEASYWKRVI